LGRRPPISVLSAVRGASANLRLGCDADHSRKLRPSIHSFIFVGGGLSDRLERERLAASESVQLENRIPRRPGAGRETRALAQISHRARHRARRLRCPHARAPRSQNLNRLPDLKLHVHAAVDALSVRRATEASRRRVGLPIVSAGPAGMRPDVVRPRSAPGKTGIVGNWLLVLRASRIVLRQSALHRRRSCEAKRNRCGSPGHGFSSAAWRRSSSTPPPQSWTSQHQSRRR
jgi:hypothetical protein